jgi:hypothetical protein
MPFLFQTAAAAGSDSMISSAGPNSVAVRNSASRALRLANERGLLLRQRVPHAVTGQQTGIERATVFRD